MDNWWCSSLEENVGFSKGQTKRGYNRIYQILETERERENEANITLEEMLESSKGDGRCCHIFKNLTNSKQNFKEERNHIQSHYIKLLKLKTKREKS